MDEDVDARHSSPCEALRPAQRSVVRTIRNIDGQYLEMQRRVFEVDVNHQMTPRVQETGTATAPASNAR
jgi:hypothetical protein